MLNFCGVPMKNPVVIASSPLTSKLKWLIEAEKAGAAAVSTKLTFIKQPFYGKLRMHTSDRLGSLICYDRRLDIDEGARLIEEAKKHTALKIFANITSDNANPDGWARLGRTMEAAGADLIEANLICPNVGLSTKQIQGINAVEKTEKGGAVQGQDPAAVRRAIEMLKASVTIPVIAKLTPNVTDIAQIAAAAIAGGADGICAAGGQSALPPIDTETGKPCYPLLNGVAHGSLGGPACRFMSFSHIAQIKRKTGTNLVGGGGLTTADEALQMMMWGADMVTVCTSVMWYGWEIVTKMVEGIDRFCKEHNTCYEAITGSALKHLRSSSQLEAVAGYPHIDATKCIGCGRCSKPGHCDAIEMANGRPKVLPENCLGCGICMGVCPVGAIRIY